MSYALPPAWPACGLVREILIMSRLPPFTRRRLAVALTALAPLGALAQTQTVVVTGNPLGRDGATQPTSVLAGEGLSLRRSGSLGETLDGLPGVAAPGFGPPARR